MQARPIDSLVDLKAWSDLYGHKPERFEIDLMRRLASVEYRVASS